VLWANRGCLGFSFLWCGALLPRGTADAITPRRTTRAAEEAARRGEKAVADTGIATAEVMAAMSLENLQQGGGGQLCEQNSTARETATGEDI